MGKETISRRDFLKLAELAMAAVVLNEFTACVPVSSQPIPEHDASSTPTTPPTTEIPTPSPTSAPSSAYNQESPKNTSSPTATSTPESEPLTLEKIDFLATHNFNHGRTDEKITMMTYDEGLVHDNVLSLLDIYKQHGAQCTFFMTGVGLQKSKDLLPRIIDEGHIIGCHGWDHEELTQLTHAELTQQFENWFGRLRQTLPNYQANYFRAPFGSWNTHVLETAAMYGMQHVGWTIESGGTTPETIDYIFDYFEERYKNAYGIGGAIVLSHTHRYYDISQASKILETWELLGYKLITVDEGKMNKDRWS